MSVNPLRAFLPHNFFNLKLYNSYNYFVENSSSLCHVSTREVYNLVSIKSFMYAFVSRLTWEVIRIFDKLNNERIFQSQKLILQYLWSKPSITTFSSINATLGLLSQPYFSTELWVTANKEVQPWAIYFKRPQARLMASAKKNIRSSIAQILLCGNMGFPSQKLRWSYFQSIRLVRRL